MEFLPPGFCAERAKTKIFLAPFRRRQSDGVQDSGTTEDAERVESAEVDQYAFLSVLCDLSGKKEEGVFSAISAVSAVKRNGWVLSAVNEQCQEWHGRRGAVKPHHGGHYRRGHSGASRPGARPPRVSLKLSECRVGLLINFNVRVLRDGIRRVVNGFPDPAVNARLGLTAEGTEKSIAGLAPRSLRSPR